MRTKSFPVTSIIKPNLENKLEAIGEKLSDDLIRLFKEYLDQGLAEYKIKLKETVDIKISGDNPTSINLRNVFKELIDTTEI